MNTWTTETWVAGTPDEVLELLTEPDAIARWAPIPFEVLDLDGPRLEAGTQARVRGSLAGRSMEFDVEIHEAAEHCLSLVATGPVSIGAEYVLAPPRRRQRDPGVRLGPRPRAARRGARPRLRRRPGRRRAARLGGPDRARARARTSTCLTNEHTTRSTALCP